MAVKASNCRYCSVLAVFANKEQVIEYIDGVCYIGGVEPTFQQVEEMAREGELLKRMSLWPVLTETVKAQAFKLGIRNATDFDQTLFCKAMLHVVEIQESAVAALLKENAKRKI